MTKSPIRYFAVIPAAGRSQRMGTEKLLLRLGHLTIIERVLNAWVDSGVDEIVIVVRHDQRELRQFCTKFDVHVVTTLGDQQHMRDTLQAGLKHIDREFSPQPDDAWLVAPADLPELSTSLIDLVLSHYLESFSGVVLPRVGTKRGHPVLLPWSTVEEFYALPPTQGLNSLVRKSNPCYLDVDDEGSIKDMDIPADYTHFLERMRESKSVL